MECYHLLQPIKLEKLRPAFSSPPTSNIGCSMVGAGSGKREAEAEAEVGSDEVISDKILFYAE
jgi:hypothetical protein